MIKKAAIRGAVGIIGAVIGLVGIFTPLVVKTHPEVMSASFFDGISWGSNIGSWQGYVLILLDVASIVLAALRKKRVYLLITGVATLALLVFSFFRIKLLMNEVVQWTPNVFIPKYSNLELSWGWFVLALGALLLIAAGLVKDEKLDL